MPSATDPTASPTTRPAAVPVSATNPDPASADVRVGSVVGERARDARQGDTVAVPVPGLGRVHLSRPQLAYVAGIAVLTATEMMAWPVGLALAAGHLLAADRDSATIEYLGEALAEA